MLRFLNFLLIFAFAISLIACGGQKKEEATVDTEEAIEEVATDTTQTADEDTTAMTEETEEPME